MSVTILDSRWGFLATLLGASFLLGGISCDGDSGTGPESPSTGTIEVTAATTGVDRDPDGYLVTLNGSRSVNIDANASLTFSDVTPGEQAVQLTGLASNCSVRGDNPQSVTVVAGATARIGFVIACAGATGSIAVTTSTAGANPDPDGYTVEIFGFGNSRIDTNGTVVIPGLAPGDYEVRLSDLASNCRWQPSVNVFQLATVSAGTTTPVTFDVTCFDGPLGTLRVRASTTGPPPFFIYFIGIDDREVGAVGVNGAADFNLSAGSHKVSLDVGPSCSVADNNRTVQVVSGATVETVFNVTCR